MPNYSECGDCRNIKVCLLIYECVGKGELSRLEKQELASRFKIPIRWIERVIRNK